MAVKILIKRKFNIERLKDASQLIIKARYGAMRQPGYISSETLSDLQDSSRIVVVSMWQNIDDWHTWKDSPERGEFEAEMRKLQDGPTEFESYALGMQIES
jgi:heme-degrading monooxygenase HmoA